MDTIPAFLLWRITPGKSLSDELPGAVKRHELRFGTMPNTIFVNPLSHVTAPPAFQVVPLPAIMAGYFGTTTRPVISGAEVDGSDATTNNDKERTQ